VSVIYGGDGGCFGGGGRRGGRREYDPRVALVWVIINDENWTFIERRVRVSEICECVCVYNIRVYTLPEEEETQSADR